MDLVKSRIRYDKNGLSNRIYTAKAIVQIKLNLEQMSFRIINATNNLCLYERGGTTNIQVLKRWAKKQLEEMFDVKFKSEARPARKGKRIGGIK